MSQLIPGNAVKLLEPVGSSRAQVILEKGDLETFGSEVSVETRPSMGNCRNSSGQAGFR